MTESQTRAHVAYRARQQKEGKLVQMAMDVTPEDKAMIKAAAAAAGKSVKNYILDLVRQDTAKEG